MGDKEIAGALRDTLMSPNVPDANLEAANVVDVIAGAGLNVSRALERLGNNNALTGMGAIEAHGKAILDAAQLIADAINNLADAVREE